MEKKLVHIERIPIRWGDMDAMGHVNNTVYFRYMEQARIGWFDALVPEDEAWKSTGIVIANASCNFKRPINYPGTVAYIGAISMDDGLVEHLRDIKLPRIYTVTSVAYDARTHTLFYTADNTAERDLMALDVTTNKQRTLLKDARIGELAFNPADQSIWGIRTFNGICTLVRIPQPYKDWNAVYSWPYGEVLATPQSGVVRNSLRTVPS